MNIFYVTNMYPTDDFVYNGIHVKEQILFVTEKYGLNYKVLFINGRKSKLNYLKSIFSIGRLLRDNDFDIMHIHFGLTGLFLQFFPFLKIPAVVTLHGSDTKKGKAYGLMLHVTRMVVRRVKKVIIMNENMIKVFHNYKNKLVVIPCGINIASFNVGRHNSGVFKIGFPGNKERPGKNYALFQTIVNQLRAEGFELEIVEFHNLTREQVVQNLSELDCLLMTSLYEGSPQIVKEAMAGGVPVVTTNVGDVKFLLADVDNCYVIDSFEAEPFFAPVKNIIALKREQRATNGNKRIAALHLDQDAVASKIFNVYKEIIAGDEKKN